MRSIIFASLISAVLVPAAFAKDAAKTPVVKKQQVEKKSLATCTSFEQTDKDDDTVEFAVTSTCDIPVDCTVSWKLVCAPKSKTRRAEHPASKIFAKMGSSTTSKVDASAGECGADAWEIDQVTWSCTPNLD